MRRRRTASSSIVRDCASILNALPWHWALAFGAFFGALFYWALPAIITWHAGSIENKILRAGIETLLHHRAHWLERIAVAIWALTLFFALWKGFTEYRLGRPGERRAGWLSRLLTRWFD